MTALEAVKKTGKGQRIDIGILDCVFSMVEGSVVAYTLNGERISRNGNNYPSISPYDTFEAKDGYISISAGTDRQWAIFCKAFGMEQYITDPRYATNEARGNNYNSGLRDEIEACTRQMTRAEIEKICLENKLPCGPVCTVPEAMANPTVAARDMLIQVNDPAMGEITMPGIPIKLTNCPGGVERGAPLLGQDTAYYLKSLGFSDADIAKLVEAGVAKLA